MTGKFFSKDIEKTIEEVPSRGGNFEMDLGPGGGSPILLVHLNRQQVESLKKSTDSPHLWLDMLSLNTALSVKWDNSSYFTIDTSSKRLYSLSLLEISKTMRAWAEFEEAYLKRTGRWEREPQSEKPCFEFSIYFDRGRTQQEITFKLPHLSTSDLYEILYPSDSDLKAEKVLELLEDFGYSKEICEHGYHISKGKKLEALLKPKSLARITSNWVIHELEQSDFNLALKSSIPLASKAREIMEENKMKEKAKVFQEFTDSVGEKIKESMNFKSSLPIEVNLDRVQSLKDEVLEFLDELRGMGYTVEVEGGTSINRVAQEQLTSSKKIYINY